MKKDYEASYNKKVKLWGTIVGLMAFVLLIVGATYAWVIFNVGESNYQTNTGKFLIEYNNDTGAGASMTGELDVSNDRFGGLSTWVNISKTEGSISGVVSLKLHLTNFTLSGICSNSSYEDKASCEAASGVWTLADASKFHVAVYTGGSCDNANFTTPSACEAGGATWTPNVLVGSEKTLAGYTTGDDVVLMNNVALTTTSTRYYVYLWLDSTATDEFGNSKIAGYIKATATQN